MVRFDCTTAAGLRDALARTHLEPFGQMAEDALRIVGERVVEYASTCSVATLFETSRELRGHTNAWWRAHAGMLKHFEERLYAAAAAEGRTLPCYTRRLDAGRNDPIGEWEAPPWHPRDLVKYEEHWGIVPDERPSANEMSWKVLKNIGTWTHVLTTRIHMEYLAWQLHPIPGFRVELVKRRHDIGTPSLYTWKVTVPGPQGSFLQNYEYDTLWEFPYGYPYNPPKILFQPGISHYSVKHTNSPGNAWELHDCPPGTPWTDVLTEKKYDTSAWYRGFRNRDLMIHLQDFLVNVCEENAAHPESMRLLLRSVPGEEHDRLRMDDEARLAYSTRLRDSGRAVVRDQTRPFGHRAVPHIVCSLWEDNEDDDERAHRLGGLLGPERALDHVVLPKALRTDQDYPPGSYVP